MIPVPKGCRACRHKGTKVCKTWMQGDECAVPYGDALWHKQDYDAATPKQKERARI